MNILKHGAAVVIALTAISTFSAAAVYAYAAEEPWETEIISVHDEDGSDIVSETTVPSGTAGTSSTKSSGTKDNASETTQKKEESSDNTVPPTGDTSGIILTEAVLTTAVITLIKSRKK